MNIFDVISNHKSIRKYKADKISSEKLTKILNAGFRASSSGNMQSYSIIVTEDPEIKQQLLEPHFNQSMVTEAPYLLTFCADFRRMRKWLEISDAPENFDNFMSFMIGAIDATLVSQNVALAAEAEGLGICYMGTTLASCDKIGKILGCPENVFPVVGFSMGFPDESIAVRDRLPMDGLVHFDTFKDYAPEQIKEIYHDRETAGWQRYMDVPSLKKAVMEKGAENLAQIYTKVKYTKKSHQAYSNAVIDYLKAQNFFNQ